MSRLESCRTAPGQAFARTLSKISAAAHSGRARSRRTFNRNNVRSWKWSTATMLEMTDCNWASAILYNSVACTNAKCVWKNSHDHGNVKSLHLRCRWMRVRAVGAFGECRRCCGAPSRINDSDIEPKRSFAAKRAVTSRKSVHFQRENG